MVTIYPQQVIPHHNKGDRIPGEEKYYQGMTNPQHICDPGPGVACWGEQYPSRGGYSDPIYWYGNTVTTLSGSYNLPTSFSTQGWQDSTQEFDKIRSTSIVKKITLEYAIANVQYSNKNTNGIYQSEGAIFYYDELGGGKNESARNSQTSYTFTLSGFGQDRTVSGQGLSVHNLTYKNLSLYDDNNISHYSSVLYEGRDKNLTIGKLKNASLNVVLPRNINYDVGRIVLKYVRLHVEYENLPIKFEIYNLDFMRKSGIWDRWGAESITTCSGNYAVIGVRIHSSSTNVDITKVKLSGTAISHAKKVEPYTEEDHAPMGLNDIYDDSTVVKKYLGGGKFETLDANNAAKAGEIIWTVYSIDKEPDNPSIWYANTLIKVEYDKPGRYSVTASLMNNRGTQDYEKTKTITVKPCAPKVAFNFLDSNDEEMQPPYQYVNTDNTFGRFQITINKSQIFEHSEQIIFDPGGLELTLNKKPNNATVKKENNMFVITGIKDDENIVINFNTYFNVSGKYKVNIYYKNLTEPSWNNSSSYDIIVKGSILPKEYFKLRLEDGTDVRYNSLMFTQGDDLLKPLHYKTDNIEDYLQYLTIIGEKKRIPVGEIQYIYFDIDFDIDKDITLNKVLTYIEINTSNNNADNIIVGSSKNVTLLEMEKDKICSIESIKSNETTRIKFAVKSDIEIEDVQIKIKPYNYEEKYTTGEWLPAYVMFKNIPNVKISIDGISELTCENYENDNEECYFWLYYHIQNLSSTTGKNVRFQLKEPSHL